jgi:hypothetical protein
VKNISDLKNNTDLSRSKHSPMTSLKVGVISGALEGAINHPLLVYKIRAQNNQSLTLNPRLVYRGLPQNIISVATIIPIRITSKDQVYESLFHTQTPSFTQTIMAAFFGGLAASPISSIVELGITQRQKDRKNITITDQISSLMKKNGIQGIITSPMTSIKNLGNAIKQERKERPTFISTYKRLSHQHGPLHLTTGMPMVGVRDILFCLAFMALAPFFKQQLTENEYIKDSNQALVVSSIVTGLFTALFAHPFDTLGAIQHKRASNVNTKEIAAKNIAKEIIQKEGKKGFYKGIFWRGIRIISAVIIFNKAAEELETTIQSPTFNN